LLAVFLGLVPVPYPPFLQSVLSFRIPKTFLSLSSLCVSVSVSLCLYWLALW
jgi:hypothetical protein